MHLYAIIIIDKPIPKLVSFFKRINYQWKYPVFKKLYFGDANIISTSIKFPFPRPISDYNTFQTEEYIFIVENCS